MQITLVSEYDPAWAEMFECIAAKLSAALDGQHTCIEHIGSTSIPGMVAKPIIDLVVIIEPGRLDEAIDALATIGFCHEGDLGIPGREAFKPDEGTEAARLPRHHLYICPKGNRSLLEQLAFRDYLREHPQQIKRLSEHKRALCIEHANDKALYIRGKSEMVREIIRAAMPDGQCLAPNVD